MSTLRICVCLISAFCHSSPDISRKRSTKLPDFSGQLIQYPAEVSMIIQLIHTHTSDQLSRLVFVTLQILLLDSSSDLHCLANEDETEIYRPNVFEHRLGKYCNFR